MGDTDDSDAEGLSESVPIPAFQNADSWLQDYKEAASDPLRVKAAHELPDDYRWSLATVLAGNETILFRKFQGEMYAALAVPYSAINKSKILICVDPIVENISLCFAKAKLLDLELAKRTQGFYIEDPNQQLTIVTPTLTSSPNLPSTTTPTRPTQSTTKPLGIPSQKFYQNNSSGLPPGVSTRRLSPSNYPATVFSESLPSLAH